MGLSVRDILIIVGFSLLQLVVNTHNTYWQFQINMPPIIIEQNFDDTSSPGASGIFYNFPYIPHSQLPPFIETEACKALVDYPKS